MGLLLNEFVHHGIEGLLAYLNWARHREGIGAKLLAFAIPVLPIALLVWLIA
jgi:hypothetical protein